MFDRRFLRYIAVGLASTVVDVLCVALLLQAGLGYPLAVSLGFAGGLAVNYLLHVAYTFGARPRAVSQAIRYAAVVGLNYFLTLAIVWFGHEVLGAAVLAAKVASLPLVAATGFLLSKYWVFRSAKAAALSG